MVASRVNSDSLSRSSTVSPSKRPSTIWSLMHFWVHSSEQNLHVLASSRRLTKRITRLVHRKNVQPRRSRNFTVLAITTAKIRHTVRFNTAPSKHRIETPFDGPRRRIPSSCPSNAVYVRLSARTGPLFRPSILSTPSTAPSLNYVFVTGTEYVEVTVIIIINYRRELLYCAFNAYTYTFSPALALLNISIIRMKIKQF